MLSNGITLIVVLALTPIIQGQTLKDEKIVMFVICFMQAVAFCLVLFMKKATKDDLKLDV
jgi:hypothetical protein